VESTSEVLTAPWVEDGSGQGDRAAASLAPDRSRVILIGWKAMLDLVRKGENESLPDDRHPIIRGEERTIRPPGRAIVTRRADDGGEKGKLTVREAGEIGLGHDLRGVIVPEVVIHASTDVENGRRVRHPLLSLSP